MVGESVKLQLTLFAILEIVLIIFATHMAVGHHWGAVVGAGLSAIVLAIMEAAMLIIWAIRGGK